MKKFMLFLIITLCFFSCTIEKRRYFKGYHVENGTLRQAQGPGKWGNGKERKWESEEVRKWESGKEGKRESVQESHCEASNNEKPQGGEILIAKDSSQVNEAPKPQRGDIVMADEMVMVDENIITDNKTNTEDGLADQKLIQPQLDNSVKSSKGGDVVDVGRVIFGMLSIVSFALALLFFGSAIFAIDSLVMTVLLLIGGGFALAGLVFLVIYALIKRKQSASGQLVGHINEEVPKEKKPISFWGVFIPFLIFAGLTVFFAIQLGMETLELAALIGYFGLIMIAFPLALLFLILTIIALVRRHRYLKMKNETPPKNYKE